MSRILIPGRVDRHGRAHPLAECRGGCQQGRAACNCELSNATPMRPRSAIWIRPAITVHRIPFGRRARRLLRDVWAFLMAPSFRG